MYIAVRIPEHEYSDLMQGHDFFARPMPWGLWIKAILPVQRNPWRFARVIDLPQPIAAYDQANVEDGELVFDREHHYKLERPNGLLVIEWIIQSIYYGTSLKFWRWPVAQDLRQALRRLRRYFSTF